MRRKNIVVIGGGTGTYTVLSGLKKYPVNLTAIVSMADDGGSNRVIRDEFGLLPTSDIRQCLVALAEENGESEKIMRSLFLHRFSRGKGIKGMTFGNLFMAALSDILGSQSEAIKSTSKILKIRGSVIPVTLDNVRLVAEYENGETVVGEHLVDEPKHDGTIRITRAFLRPRARANPEAIKAILNAHMVILGPGDLYTSLVANLLVQGISQALCKTRAKVVYILNLMTRYGQTYGFSARDHVVVLAQYLGRARIDGIVVNSEPLPKNVLKKYKNEKSAPVVDDFQDTHTQIMRFPLVQEKEYKKMGGDILQRSFIRHDSDKLAKVLLSFL